MPGTHVRVEILKVPSRPADGKLKSVYLKVKYQTTFFLKNAFNIAGQIMKQNYFQ